MPDPGLAQEFEFSRCEHDWLARSLSPSLPSLPAPAMLQPLKHERTCQYKRKLVCCSNWFLALHILYDSLQFGTVDAEIVDPLLRTQS